MEKLYDRIDWNNNTSPALNDTNLNLMSKAVDDIDDRVVDIAGTVMETVPQIQQYLSEADAIVERLQELTENPPYIGQNGNWYVWDTNTGAYVDSGVDASITVSIADITMIGVNENPRVTNTGTNTDPVFHLFIPAANGIASIAKTGTSGLTDTYTVTFDKGNTTTFTVVNGRGITKIEKTGTEDLVDTYTITYNDNSTSTFTVTNGKDGRNTDQVSVMPEASEDELRNIYQFVGTTTANYTHGYYYECKYDSENDLYFWDNINVGELAVAGQDVSDAVENTITDSTANYPEYSAGETLKVIFGKIKKFLSDLKGNKTDLTNLATVEPTSTASKSYSIDDWLIYNGQLYEVTAPISSGGTITVGTNVEPTTVEDGKSSGGGHTILNGSGSAMTQRGKLQFVGGNVKDDSTNDKTVVTVDRELTQAEYDALTTAEKNNGTTYYIKDAPSSYTGVPQSMIGDAWVSGHAYAVDDYCIDGNVLYKCKTAHTSSASNRPPYASYWDAVSVASELASKGESSVNTVLKYVYDSIPLVTIKKDVSSNSHIAGKVTPYKVDFGLYSKIVVACPGGNGGWIAVIRSDDSAFSSFTVINEVQISSAQTINCDISSVTGEYYVGLIYNQGGTSTSIANMSVTTTLTYFEVNHRGSYARVSECHFEV